MAQTLRNSWFSFFFLIKGMVWLVLLGLVVFGIVDKDAVERFREWLPF
jgi:hypothetical protein